jgi:hypothetical protein
MLTLAATAPKLAASSEFARASSGCGTKLGSMLVNPPLTIGSVVPANAASAAHWPAMRRAWRRSFHAVTRYLCPTMTGRPGVRMLPALMPPDRGLGVLSAKGLSISEDLGTGRADKERA